MKTSTGLRSNWTTKGLADGWDREWCTLSLLVGTGSSGVSITRKLAEKIGASKLSEQALEGVGKSGPAVGYKAWVDKVVIGDLEFHDCFVQATPREIAEVDGIIGMDVFSKYLITLDMPARK